MPVDVRFIEWMPFGGNKWDDKKFYSYQQMLEKIATTHPRFSRHQDGPNDTAKHWQVPGSVTLGRTTESSSTRHPYTCLFRFCAHGFRACGCAVPMDVPVSAPLLSNSHKGRVGFITSMTENFCGTCNRLRITADGNLKVCLFDNKEVSLRDILRSVRRLRLQSARSNAATPVLSCPRAWYNTSSHRRGSYRHRMLQLRRSMA